MSSWGQAVVLDAPQVLPVPMRVLPVPSWEHWGQVVALNPLKVLPVPSWGQAVALYAPRVLLVPPGVFPMPLRVFPVPSWSHWGWAVTLNAPKVLPVLSWGWMMALNTPQVLPVLSWGLPSALLGTIGGTTAPHSLSPPTPSLASPLPSGDQSNPPILAEPPLGEDDEDKDLEPTTVTAPKATGQTNVPSDTDITAEFLQPLLTPENVANLVRERDADGGRGGFWCFEVCGGV